MRAAMLHDEDRYVTQATVYLEKVKEIYTEKDLCSLRCG